jgi:hypothetical protein
LKERDCVALQEGFTESDLWNSAMLAPEVLILPPSGSLISSLGT